MNDAQPHVSQSKIKQKTVLKKELDHLEWLANKENEDSDSEEMFRLAHEAYIDSSFF